jgi:hypothetical protein
VSADDPIASPHGVPLRIEAEEIGALLSRLARHLSWRLGEHGRLFESDLYLVIPCERMFEVHEIQHPPVDVGSLHDDVAELRKLLAYPEHPVTPVVA